MIRRDAARSLAMTAAALLIAGPAAAQGKAASIEGDWQGSLHVGQKDYRLILHVTPAPEGLPNASLDSPDQGVEAIPGRVIDQTGATSRILFLDVGGDYAATLSEDGKTLTGKWNQGLAPLPLVMTRTAAKAP